MGVYVERWPVHAESVESGRHVGDGVAVGMAAVVVVLLLWLLLLLLLRTLDVVV